MSALIMRDELIKRVTEEMASDDSIYFVTADFGSPALDKLKTTFPDRYINVGIAEQNLINVSTGLALEGATVFAYAIAPFITMRCFEQIRVNLAALSELKKLNVNLVGVGAGFSYVCSGPSHQALEDISIMRTLPNLEILSPSDWVTSKEIVKYAIKNKCPKYIRLDGMKLDQIYEDSSSLDFNKGFTEITEGDQICLLATGYMTHKAKNMLSILKSEGTTPGLIDLYKLTNLQERSLIETIQRYQSIITMEEGFIDKGGLDSLILHIINKNKTNVNFYNFGLSNNYQFALGDREEMHTAYGASAIKLKKLITDNWK